MLRCDFFILAAHILDTQRDVSLKNTVL